jgi:hypothetical protein
MIHSDKIFTITDPKATLLEKYEKLTKWDSILMFSWLVINF